MPLPEVLVDGQRWGDRFVALLGTPVDPGWVGAEELFGAGLGDAIEAVGRARGTRDAAVAGTLLFEQYALRLAAPVLAAHHEGAHLDASLRAVRAQVVEGAVRRLAFAHPASAGGDLSSFAAGLEHAADAVHAATRIGTRVLRGAMANAAVSALLHLSWTHTDRDHHVADALALLARIPGWAGLVTVRSVEVAGERWMYTDRNTCCQAFRTTVNRGREQRFCATCPVTPRETTAEMFAGAVRAYAGRRG